MLATLTLAALAFGLPTQSSTPAPARDPLERVVVIGASLAAGFGADRTMAEALEASLREPVRPVLGLGDFLFFTSPLAIGDRQVEAASDADPSLVVAIDFLFWFGYGNLDAKGQPIEVESQRLELLERGLRTLGELECPLVVGDFPDMSAAVGTMLAPAQMPAATTLPLLSRRVREWAAARPNTLVLPLSEMVAKLDSDEPIAIGRHTFPAGSELLQSDHLHPNLEGLVLTAQLVGDALVERKLVPAEALERERAGVLAKLKKGRTLLPAGAGR